MHERLARCHLIAKVLAADGMMKDEERKFLRSAMEAAGLDADEQRQVIEFDGHDKALDAALSLSADKRKALADDIVEAALKDGKLSPVEMEVAKKIAAKLTGV